MIASLINNFILFITKDIKPKWFILKNNLCNNYGMKTINSWFDKVTVTEYDDEIQFSTTEFIVDSICEKFGSDLMFYAVTHSIQLKFIGVCSNKSITPNLYMKVITKKGDLYSYLL